MLDFEPPCAPCPSRPAAPQSDQRGLSLPSWVLVGLRAPSTRRGAACLLSTASQGVSPQCVRRGFRSRYRCGAALESHQVPLAPPGRHHAPETPGAPNTAPIYWGTAQLSTDILGSERRSRMSGRRRREAPRGAERRRAPLLRAPESLQEPLRASESLQEPARAIHCEPLSAWLLHLSALWMNPTPKNPTPKIPEPKTPRASAGLAR